MQFLATAEQMRSFDRTATARYGIPSIVLMENAGAACVGYLEEFVGPLEGKRVLVVAGKGNNGGDGFVISRHLLNCGCNVEVMLLGDARESKGDALTNLRTVRKLKGAGLTFFAAPSAAKLKNLKPPDIIVDALFGTGFSGSVRGMQEKAIRWINESGALVLSVDIPSGVDATTGRVENVAVRADLTVSMGLPKVGHFTGEGRDCRGELVIGDIGVPAEAIQEGKDSAYLLEASDVAKDLPKRSRTAHKYGVGKVFVLAGSRSFTGAPALCSTAALRAGAGAVVLGVPESIYPVMARKLTEVILVPLPETSEGTLAPDARAEIMRRVEWADVVALGPGMGRSEETDSFILELLNSIDKPVVLDADGLTAAAKDPKKVARRRASLVMTPHAGELSRLTGEPASAIELDRVKAAREAARRFRCTVVLKGAPTATGFQGGEVVLNSTGNPGMATIGMGDVLTGVIASLAAQGMVTEMAAVAGVYVHGRAGDLAAEKFGFRSLLASDVIDLLSTTFTNLEG